MKRTTIFIYLSLFLLTICCEDEKQIIDNPNNNEIIVDEGDTIRIDSLFLSQAGSTNAIIGLLISIPDSIDEIECGIEFTTDSTFKDGATQKVKSTGAIMENYPLTVILDNLRPNERYFYRAYYLYKNNYNSGKTKTFKTLPLECSYVDLGLSVNWATCNIGASSPEELGDYYAWGEISTKETYNWTTYKWKKENSSLLTKYCSIEEYGYADKKNYLDSQDDVAQSLFGNDWFFPSDQEWLELVNNCKWEWTTINNNNGWLITSLIDGFTDKSIFLPASGIKKENKLESTSSNAYYWSRQVYDENPRVAHSFFIDSLEHTPKFLNRCYGLPVRPVCISSDWYEIASIRLSSEERTVFSGYSFTLTPTVYYKDSVVNRIGIWSSDNPSVVAVDETGFVIALSEGSANIYYTINSIQAKCAIRVLANESEIEHSYVDLGLSVNWATFNVGAIMPEDKGGLYAWGEVETKDSYTNSNYKFPNGYTEGLTTLSLNDDVAHVKWGDLWRMPSPEELEELIYNCNWTYSTLNGISGYIVTSKITGYTDRSIFLPSTKPIGINYNTSSYYWSNSIETKIWRSDDEYKSRTLSLPCNMGNLSRYIGCSVRPVYPSDSWLSTINISIDCIGDSTTLIPGKELYTLMATIKKNNETIQVSDMITWSSTNPLVADVTSQIGSYNSIKALAPGSTTITASIQSLTAQYEIKVFAESEIEHDYVDLGLSVNWATFNVGALEPSDIGQHYAWGETELKNDYNIRNYKWYENVSTYGSNNKYTITKYNYSILHGNVDNKTVLDLIDDVAHVNWGEGWRMPTKEEFDELINNCDVQKYGESYVITSKIDGFTDRSIILPTTYRYYSSNKGHYWSSSLNRVNPDYYYSQFNLNDPDKAFSLCFEGDEYNPVYTNRASRCYGLPIRPVIESNEWSNHISLNISNESIIINPNINADFCLSVTAMNKNMDNSNLIQWASEDPSIAIVNDNGVVSAISGGTTIISAYIKDVSAKCTVTVIEPDIVKEYVDLGLSVKWATCNIGAEKPEEAGYYYSWGEITPKNDYSNYNYKYAFVYDGYYLTKYCDNSFEGYGDFIDYKTTLYPEDDVAHLLLGGNWRMPTYSEAQELVDQCDWTWTSINGMNGYLITSKKTGYENKSLFIPASGLKYNNNGRELYGYDGGFWTNTLYPPTNNLSDYLYGAYIRFYSKGYTTPWYGIGSVDRYYGLPIRPVCP